MSHICIIEDDAAIAEIERDYLEINGFTVSIATDGVSGLNLTQKESFDLILLDLMLPQLDGFTLCRKLRERLDIPILMVTAKKEDIDKIRGLGLGADDYITKPFSVTEVLARIKANIRRSTQYSKPAEPENEMLVIGDLIMNLTDYTVTKKNVRVDLTAKEYEILKLLLQNPKKVYTKEQMYSLIWNDAYLGDENAVNVHISRLRNKIEDNPRTPKYVITVWGIGYKLGDLS